MLNIKTISSFICMMMLSFNYAIANENPPEEDFICDDFAFAQGMCTEEEYQEYQDSFGQNDCVEDFLAASLTATTNADSNITLGDDEALFTTSNAPECPFTITGPGELAKGNVTVNQNNQLVFDPYGDFDTLPSGQTEVVNFQFEVANDSDEFAFPSIGSVAVTVNGLAPVVVEDDCTGAFTAANLEIVASNETTTIIGDNEALYTTNNPDSCTATITGPNAELEKGNVTVVNNQLVFDPYGDFDSLEKDETETVTFTFEVANDATEEAASSGEISLTVTGEEKPFTARSVDYRQFILYEIIANESIVENSHTLTITHGAEFPVTSSDIQITQEKKENMSEYEFNNSDLALTYTEESKQLTTSVPAMNKDDILIVKVVYSDNASDPSSGSESYDAFTLIISENETEKEVVKIEDSITKSFLSVFVAFLALLFALFYFYKKPAKQAKTETC